MSLAKPDALKASASRLFLQISWASILLAVSGISLAAQSAPRDLKPVDAVQGIVAAFQQHSAVIIGEAHWLRQAGDFYIGLVRDPAFQETVQDIVVEFASRNNQPLLDRYVAGEDVPIDDVRHIWRATTKVASWESPFMPNGLRRFAKSTRNCRRLVACVCSRATRLLIDSASIPTLIGQRTATTTYRSQTSS